jgi:hypothetical protein
MPAANKPALADGRKPQDSAPDFPRALFSIRVSDSGNGDFYSTQKVQLEAFLTKLPGVKAFSIFKLTQTAEVYFDMLHTDIHSITQAVSLSQQLGCSFQYLDTQHPRRTGKRLQKAPPPGVITMEIHRAEEEEEGGQGNRPALFSSDWHQLKTAGMLTEAMRPQADLARREDAPPAGVIHTHLRTTQLGTDTSGMGSSSLHLETLSMEDKNEDDDEAGQEGPKFDQQTGFPLNTAAERIVAGQWRKGMGKGAVGGLRSLKIPYAHIKDATRGFSAQSEIGHGGSCKV